MASSGFELDLSGLISSITQMGSKVDAAVGKYAEDSAEMLEDYAKLNRKWTDRSGDARRSLKGSSRRVTKGYQLELAHGVNYGLWLELANEKHYAIIQPTILANSNDIMTGLSGLMNKVKV